MGWTTAGKEGKCPRCRSPIAAGSQIFKSATWVCEACGKDIEENGVPAGEVEQGVLNDLGKLPDEASTSSIAKASLKIARVLDSNEISPRDMAPLIKELRQNRAALLSLYPPEEDDDPTETARKNREEFVGSTWEEPWSG